MRVSSRPIGTRSVDPITTCARLVRAADRPRAGRGPRDGREVRLGAVVRPNPPNLPTGSDGPKPATLAGLPGAEPADRQVNDLAGFDAPKPTSNLPTGSPGPASKCEPLREQIAAKVAEGLTARRIHQDLGGAASSVGYDSVRRFIQRLGRTRPPPFRRLPIDPACCPSHCVGRQLPVETSGRIEASASRKGVSTGNSDAVALAGIRRQAFDEL